MSKAESNHSGIVESQTILKKALNALMIEKDYLKALDYYSDFEKTYPDLKFAINANKKIAINKVIKHRKSSSYTIVVSRSQKINPIISIIVPVFNTEKYVNKCLESILNQSFVDIEIICVDDGSTDDSLGILLGVARRDNRVTVVTQENKFAGVARNVGIELAKGQFFLFLDSDDFLEKDACKILYENAVGSNADIVVCDVNFHDEKLNRLILPGWTLRKNLLPLKSIFNPSEVSGSLFNFTNNWVWNKLFKSDFIRSHEIKFQELRHTNDLFFMCACLVSANSIMVTRERLINYRVNVDNSLTSVKTRNESCYDVIESLKAVKFKLDAIGLFDLYKRSFHNLSISQLHWNFSKIKCKQQRSKFKKSVVLNDFFGLSIDVDKEYFYDESVYDQHNEFCAKFTNEDILYLTVKNIYAKYKVISFDIFDTLIFRSVSKPADVFLLMEHMYGLPEFAAARIKAEKEARRVAGHSEIRIDDIYEWMDESFQSMKPLEVEREADVVFPNELMVNLLNDLVNKGCRVILTSDMYLSVSDVTTLLERCGIRGYSSLYVSSMYRKSKKNGDIFSEIVLAENIAFNDLLHIGDNLNSDFDVPRSLGISSLAYVRSEFFDQFFHRSELGGGVGDLSRHLSLSIFNQLRQYQSSVGSNDFWFDVGFNLAGPLAFSLVKSVTEHTKKISPDFIFYIARDGFILRNIHEVIDRCNIPLHYVYASRGLINNIRKGQVLDEDYAKYLHSVAGANLDGKKILIVDTTTINFTAQKFFVDFLEHSYVLGYYWLANDDVGSSLNYSSVFLRPNKVEAINFFIETLLSAPTPPVNKIIGGAPIHEEPSVSEMKRCEISKKINKGAISFAQQVASGGAFQSLGSLLNPSFVLDLIFDYLNNLSSKQRFAISEISHTGDLFNKDDRSLGVYLTKFKRPSISIIVCVLNGEDFLEECLNSLANQSLNDIEVICVDDFSTDSSYEIIKRFCSRDQRFRVVRNFKNNGLATSRNMAIRIARGEYIQFVDADDYLVDNACHQLHSRCVKLNLDMLMFSGWNFNDSREIYENKYWGFNYLPSDWSRTWFSFKDCEAFASGVAVSSCLTIYKASFLHEFDIEFPDGVFYEDNLFFSKSFVKARRISIHKGKFYYRRVHDGSITQNWNKHFSDYLKVSGMVLDFLSSERIGDGVIRSYKNKFAGVVNYFYKDFPTFDRAKYKVQVQSFAKKYKLVDIILDKAIKK